MRGVVQFLGSVKLALLGMGLLAVGAGLSYGNPDDVSVWVLVAPLALLSFNLLTAIIVNPRINRRPGLLTFHLGLLGVVILAAIGRMTFLDAHVELLQDTPFASSDILDSKKGLWHNGDLDKVAFVQGPYTVEYSARMVRGLTHNHVHVPNAEGQWETREIGDDRPLVLENYRFYTSFNKGFAPVLTWEPVTGEPVTGAVHMPSYPLYEYKQDNHWTPPGGKEIKFWLRLDTGLRQDAPWVLDAKQATGILVINTGGKRVELRAGETVELDGGKLRYERLSTWMGYRIFYDPTLQALFWVSVIGVFGLFAHFWQKLALRAASESLQAQAGNLAARS